MSDIVETTYREDRISAVVEVRVMNSPLGNGERIAKARARKKASDIIPFRKQKVERAELKSSSGGATNTYFVTIKHQNPRSEFGSRQVRAKEQELWERFRSTAMDPYREDLVSVTSIAQGISLHETKSREIVKVWEREGLVRASHNFNKAHLTDKGEKTPKLPPA